MVEKSYEKHIKVSETKEMVVCYNLISEDGMYGVECYVEHKKRKNEMNHCMIKDFTRDRQKGLQFVEMISNGEALPIHVHDILEDYMAE